MFKTMNLHPTQSSLYSASSSVSSSDSNTPAKKFKCTYSGCTKSFSRSEHLHRHALNHKDGDQTCVRCSAHFRRRDLLDRHMQRHKEKDDSAGGEGKGVLATRKRLWKDKDGNIIASRRPQDPSKLLMRSSSGDSNSIPNYTTTRASIPTSTPTLISTSGSNSNSDSNTHWNLSAKSMSPESVSDPASPPSSIPSVSSSHGAFPVFEGLGFPQAPEVWQMGMDYDVMSAIEQVDVDVGLVGSELWAGQAYETVGAFGGMGPMGHLGYPSGGKHDPGAGVYVQNHGYNIPPYGRGVYWDQ